MSELSLRGKVALVTGSARRIGKTIALELARQGMHQVVHYRDSEREANETAGEIRALGVQAFIVKADLSNPTEINALFDEIRTYYGRLDLLVNNASVFAQGNILDLSLEAWRHTLDINLTGPFLCSQHAARMMLEHDGGSIINILDLSAFHPWKTRPQHSVSKAGLKMLTEVMALSLGPKIRINGIAPGFMLRDGDTSPEQWNQLTSRSPLGHAGDPSDVARAVLFLAQQPYITGVTLQVDGGDNLT